MTNYGDKCYWDQRYTKHKGSTFDWLENYTQLKQVLELFVERDHRILNMGCGNGEIQEEMYDDGYENIINIDISEVVIE